ncbi:MAG: hypothetical protein LBN34_00850 [Clostridiales Family XIII bacterium]|jgi:hypothetical protein|nr:hypothetical protein [Clostridiales Family XIII bacterium]
MDNGFAEPSIKKGGKVRQKWEAIMKKLTLVTLITLFALMFAFAGCSGIGKGTVIKSEDKTGDVEITEANGDENYVQEIPEGEEGSDSAAYLAAIKKFATQNTGKILGLDMANIDVKDPEQLKKMVENYCTNSGWTFEEGDLESFKDKKGLHITFSDVNLSPSKLTAEASVWRSSTGEAKTESATVDKKNGYWAVDGEMTTTFSQ